MATADRRTRDSQSWTRRAGLVAFLLAVPCASYTLTGVVLGITDRYFATQRWQPVGTHLMRQIVGWSAVGVAAVALAILVKVPSWRPSKRWQLPVFEFVIADAMTGFIYRFATRPAEDANIGGGFLVFGGGPIALALCAHAIDQILAAQRRDNFREIS